MVTIRAVNEIISSLIDFFRIAQPDLDIKPGTVARDLFIEGPAAQLSLLYDELSGVSDKQSLILSVGSDLDKLAKNFGILRKQSTTSTGPGLLTFSSLNSTINIPKGSTIFSKSGLAFTVSTGISLVPSNLNYYRSVASKYSAQLTYAGISDQYAIQITAVASSPGSSGNIGQYSLSRTNIPGISNVTNVVAFAGGTDQETDAAFRNRILSAFSGSSVGTALGYLNAALSVAGVSDATVIEPGDPLMARDGTVSTFINGTLTIVSEGTGGKVDVVVLGSVEQQNTDTFIYQDKSNNNEPTNYKNNFVLGQLSSDANKTISQKRINNMANGQLPFQPVNSITQVTGSQSGPNFTEYSIDQYGIGSGNYQLIKDTGVYGGSPFGFDTFVWKNNQIVFEEDLVKGQNNGQDSTTYKDIIKITGAQQYLNIINENSIVNADRSIIQLLHSPVTNVTRVFNVNTGERYIITNQNLDATSPFNNTGRIQISGNTLPSPSDTLQVDYNWIVNFDQYSDFDGLYHTNNIRPVTDNIDWGYASEVRSESVNFALSAGNNFFIGNTIHPIDTVVSVNQFLQIDGYVQAVASGVFVNRLSVVISRLAMATESIDSITWKNSNAELYKTSQGDNSFSNTTQVVGINLLYITTIILPTDTIAQIGDRVVVYLNSTNVFQSGTTSGSSNGNQITIPTSLINTIADNINLKVNYIADISDLFSIPITSLPSSRSGNGYLLANNNGFNNFSIANTSRRENQVVQLNFSNQDYIELNLPSSDYSLYANQIVSVIRLSDGKEIWNNDNIGQVIIGLNGNYQLIFTGYNTPVVNDRVLVIYYATDSRRFQPFSFSNDTIKTRIDSLGFDFTTQSFTVPLVSFTAQASGLKFQIIEPESNIVYYNITDGYLTLLNQTTATLNSLTANFSTLTDLINKRVRIYDATTTNNDGYFDIIGYNINTNTISITSSLDKITKDQVAVVRILDGQEIWNYGGTIDHVNNRLLIPISSNASVGDKAFVMFFNFRNARKAPTRIIGTTLDQSLNTGSISISGTSINLAENIVFTATNTGLHQNLQEALRKVLKLNSSNPIPSNIKLAKIVKLEKVITYSLNNDIVIETLATYDTLNSIINNNLLYVDEMLSDNTLSNLDFILPNTTNNSSSGTTNNLPLLGDKLRVSFYYTADNDQENLSYTRIGSLYTNKKFALINKVYVGSGFKSSQATKFTATSFTKPSLGARYTSFYNYLAPKQNERILIQYNFNKLISDVSFAVENSRPINADVLVRSAKLLKLDLIMNVVIASGYFSTQTTVLQNLRDQMVAAMTTTTLGQTVDQITLINIAQGVQGIARARILYFNVSGNPGQVLSITAQKDEYFQSNNITLNTETR